MIRCALSFIVFLLLSLPVLAATEPGPSSGADFVYDEHSQRDPFLPLVTAGGAIVTYETSFSVAEMTLEGIVSDGEGGIAIINGTVVEQGKNFGAYMVEKIESDKVTLVKDGVVSELRIKKEE